jgi:hypothetical protein
MVWLIAILAIVFFAIAYSGFRKFLLGSFIAMIAIGIGIYLYVENEQYQREKRRSLVSSSDVDFQNLVLGNQYGSWNIKGLVKNNSRYQIEQIKLMISVLNCDGDGKNCVIVGSDDNVTGYLDIPPGQARALDAFVTLSNLPKLTNWHWNYRVSYIQPK